MLLEITIDHLALIDRLTISFGQGFNALTGETGAGKSIVVDAVNLVLGERADKDMIQVGADKAVVEALFDVSDNAPVLALLQEMDIEAEEGLLSISRELTSVGKNICRLCGRIVPLSMLKPISALLLDIHGQHEHQSLIDEKYHLAFLDQFAGHGLEAQRRDVAALYDAWQKCSRALAQLKQSDAQREQRIDLLTYQIRELEAAKLQEGEEETLTHQRAIFRNSEKITTQIQRAFETIYQGDEESGAAALDALRSGGDAMGQIADIDERYAQVHSRLQELYYQLEDVSLEIRTLKDETDFDPREAEAVEARLDVLHRLGRKYGATTREMLAHLEKAKTELAQIEDASSLLETLTQQEKSARKALWEASLALSAARKEAAKRFEEQIVVQLRDLGMKHASFEVQFAPLPEKKEMRARFSAQGIDLVSFMMSANLGQPLKPLVRVASGGELSRIMLALKNIAAEKTGIPSMVFDEIDTGISGRIAQVVAEKMTEIASRHQVICVTHLPQIAAMADTHFLVEKHDEAGQTRTLVHPLGMQERYTELARMIGGAQENSESSLRHAQMMLEEAKARKEELRAGKK